MEAVRDLRRAIHRARRIRSLPQWHRLPDRGRQRIRPHANRGDRRHGTVFADAGRRVSLIVFAFPEQSRSEDRRFRFDVHRLPGFNHAAPAVPRLPVDGFQHCLRTGEADHERDPANRQLLEPERRADGDPERARAEVRSTGPHPAAQRRAGRQLIGELQLQCEFHGGRSVPQQQHLRQ